MRLRTTAAALVGALALVLPTAGPSLADDHGDRVLGTLNYRFVNDNDIEESGQIRPADTNTCYVLARTSQDKPAIAVQNNTKSRAHLFANRNCSGEEVATLRPDGQVNRVGAVSAYFTPVDAEDDGRGDNDGRGDWNNGGDQGRGDQGRDDQARDDEARDDLGRDDQGRDDEARDDQARDDEARDDQGRGDQARDDQARDDQARDDQARDDQARDDEARDDQGRGDQARDDQARDDQARDQDEDEEDLLDVVFRAIG
ncbi:hypothetical protein ACFVFI_01560 [Streptomyces sp. NPDC057705]|uniref:hypothetical protein n=1 Tax=Streptomyces sp. NPDC057705 TaxID=3346222 RepID=UPI0036C1C8B6